MVCSTTRADSRVKDLELAHSQNGRVVNGFETGRVVLLVEVLQLSDEELRLLWLWFASCSRYVFQYYNDW
jgi:hypothetical protein